MANRILGVVPPPAPDQAGLHRAGQCPVALGSSAFPMPSLGPTVQCSKLYYTRTVPIVMCNMDVFHQVHFPVHTLTPNLTCYMVQVT